MTTWSVDASPDPGAVLTVRTEVTKADLGLDDLLAALQERARAAGAPVGAHEYGLLSDGILVGRLLLDEGLGTDWALVDLAVHPSQQGRGLGGWAVAWLCERARARGATVDLHVAGRAQALYARAGFVALSSDEVRTRMRWAPDPVTALVRAASEDDGLRARLLADPDAALPESAALGWPLTAGQIDEAVAGARSAFNRRWVV